MRLGRAGGAADHLFDQVARPGKTAELQLVHHADACDQQLMI